jgi:dihydrodipicolinate synthase/N-acetylneuraminate lyase
VVVADLAVLSDVDGLVPGLGNVDPHRMGRYSSAIGAFKEALAVRGVIADATTSLPMTPLDAAERSTVRAALRAADLGTGPR